MFGFARKTCLVVPFVLALVSSHASAGSWLKATPANPLVGPVAQRSAPLVQNVTPRVTNYRSYCVWPVPLGCMCRHIDYGSGCCVDMFCSMKTHQ
ncbi:MAG TPA: hypothetical protein VKX28_05155 [Xanthobacteraceae bacterium]|nr:hypothetical protein [Xanthobacteraceae bacterium]